MANNEPTEVESVSEVLVKEFDFGTSIQMMNDGTVRLKVDTMPPSWASARYPFDAFVPAMQAALGVTVVGLDKELFSVPAPQPDTVERLRSWLLALRQNR